jgi:catechol 2,3-dioxygenase-like lactoylglutathione lyase family enzyme
MKRMHVHIRVENLQPSIDFYTRLLGAAPLVVKDDYAKWSCDEPSLNLAISDRGVRQGSADTGIAHLGIEMSNAADVARTSGVLESRDVWVEGETTCCYAQSEKSWAEDPQNVQWEIFHTHGDSEEWGNEAPAARLPQQACCS